MATSRGGEAPASGTKRNYDHVSAGSSLSGMKSGYGKRLSTRLPPLNPKAAALLQCLLKLPIIW